MKTKACLRTASPRTASARTVLFGSSSRGRLLCGLTALSLAVMPAVSPAWALSLEEAKAHGLVGETPSGYLDVVQQSPEATAVANDINAQRKQAYQQIAAKNGSPLSAVEQIAGKQAIEKAAPGTMVKLPNGSWKKK